MQAYTQACVSCLRVEYMNLNAYFTNLLLGVKLAGKPTDWPTVMVIIPALWPAVVAAVMAAIMVTSMGAAMLASMMSATMSATMAARVVPLLVVIVVVGELWRRRFIWVHNIALLWFLVITKMVLCEF